MTRKINKIGKYTVTRNEIEKLRLVCKKHDKIWRKTDKNVYRFTSSTAGAPFLLAIFTPDTFIVRDKRTRYYALIGN